MRAKTIQKPSLFNSSYSSFALTPQNDSLVYTNWMQLCIWKIKTLHVVFKPVSMCQQIVQEHLQIGFVWFVFQYMIAV